MRARARIIDLVRGWLLAFAHTRARARPNSCARVRACVHATYATTVPVPNLWGVVVGKSCWGGGGDGVMLLL